MSKTPSPLLLAATTGLSLMLGACGAKAPPGAPPPPTPYAEAILYDGTGQQRGKVTLMPENGALKGTIEIASGLKPGDHGMHIHTIGECKLPDFVSAGPHLNPDSKQHGMQNPAGPHQGDLPLLQVSSGGSAKMNFTANTTLDQIFDPDGSAFIVHADADDMKTDPTGNSGGRVLCGVLYRKQS